MPDPATALERVDAILRGDSDTKGADLKNLGPDVLVAALEHPDLPAGDQPALALALAEFQDDAPDGHADDAPDPFVADPGLPADGQLVAALAAAQATFPTIAKNNTATIPGKDGKAGYSYAYADLGDILAAVRPVLARHGLALTQRTLPIDGGKTQLLTQLRHVGGGVLESEIHIATATTNPQAFGGTLTYLRRYEIVTLLGIAAEQDLDAQDVPVGRPANGAPAPAAPPQWAREAGRDRVGEVGPLLIPLIGLERTRALLATIKANLGIVPDVVVATLKLVGQEWALEHPETATARIERMQAEQRAREDEAAARVKAEEASAAAEAPDAPAPEPEPDVPPDEPVDEPAPEELAPPDAVERPSAGSVPPPNVEASDDEEELVNAYREAGCICADPLGPAPDDTCPIKGHGIPF